MTILDEVFNFSDLQSMVASNAAETVSTDVIDSGSDMKDAFGTAIYDARLGSQAKAPVVVCTIGTGITASAIITVAIKSKAASATITSSGTTHVSSAFAAGAAANTQLILPVPVSGMNRYWGLTYTVSGTAVLAGTMNAYLADAGELHD